MKKLPPLFLIYFICFSVSHGVPGIIPLLPTFQQEFALNSYEVANCLAYFSYSALIATPFMGFFYNKVSKKFFIYCINCIYLTGIVGISFSSEFSELLIFRIVQGIGSAGINLLVNILPAEYYRGLKRGRIMGKSNGIIALGLFFNPLVTGFLALYSWRLSIFYLYLPTCFTLLILTFTDLTEKFSHPHSPFSFAQIKEILKTPLIFILFASLFLTAGLDLSLPSIFALFTADTYGYDSSTIGLFYSAANLGMFISSFFFLSRLLPSKKFPQILLCCCLCTTSILLFFTALPIAVGFMAFFAYFCLSGIIIPYCNFSISTAIPVQLITLGFTVSATVFRAGQGMETAFLAFIANEFGYETAFALTGSLLFVVALLLLLFNKKKNQRSFQLSE